MGSTNRKSAGGHGVGDEIINATQEQQAAQASTCWRKRAGAALIAAAVAAITAPVTAQEAVETTATQSAEAAHDYSIPAGTLADALHRFSEQSGLQVFFESELVHGKTAPELNTRMAAQDALNTLLAGSGLIYEFVNNRTLILRRSPDAAVQREGAAVTDSAAAALAAGSLIQDEDITTESVTSIKRGGIEEIIVTARRREESVQDIPISITALSKEDMKTFGIKNVGDMEGIVPGLNMSGGGNGLKKDSNPFIRGIGQRETKVTLDPGVGSYLDGIYLARTAGALLDTVGMESVQVLRGPQGTLFGKNVAGGAIAFNTIKPQPGLGGSLTATVGNFGRSDVLAIANIPLIGDTLLSRFTLSSKNSEGHFTNVEDNSKWGEDNRITGIGQIRWNAAENLTVDVLTERTRIRETPRPSRCKVVRPIDLSGSYATYWEPGNVRRVGDSTDGDYVLDENGQPLVYTERTPISNYNPYQFNPLPVQQMDAWRTSNGNPEGRKTFHQTCADAEASPQNQFSSDMAEGNDLLDKGRYWIDTATIGVTPTWEIGELGPLKKTQLKSISAWRQVNQIADEDLDATGYAQMLRVQDGFNETSQISQELQFSGNALEERLFFSTGLYYFKEKTPQDVLIRTAGIDHGNPFEGFQGPPLRVTAAALEASKETLETENEAYAWYGQLDFKLTPQVEVTAGLRYTQEERWTAYTKAYAMGPSMAQNYWQDGNSFPADWANTQFAMLATDTAFATIFDWRFYSADFPGCEDIFSCYIPGFNGYPLGIAYGRKEASVKEDAWTPMASIKYHAGERLLDAINLDSAMLYFTYSKGFTSGGVTSGAVDRSLTGGYIRIEDPVIFKPQYVDNYEIGLKSQGFGRRIQTNLALFYTDFTDMQITSVANRGGIPIPWVDNVGKAVIKGVEAEILFMPTQDWRVMLNASYTDAELKEWNARNVILDFFTGQPQQPETYTVQDRSDEPMPRVPKWQAYLMTDYVFQVKGGGTLTPVIAARYSSEIYHGFDRGSYCYTVGGCNISKQVENPVYSTARVPGGEDAVMSDEVVFLDARITYLSADGKVEVAAWGKNLTNKDDYLVGAIPLVDVTGTVGQVFADPRTFGLTMTYNFGAR